MSDTSIQNSFGVNLAGSLLQNTGLNINTVTEGLVGVSHTVSSYTPGTLITETCLKDLTLAIKAGYDTLGVNLNTSTYGNLISIGSSTIPALGNSKPPTYTWVGPANNGDSTSTAAQEISWYPYTATATTNTYPTSLPTPRQYSDLTSTTYNPNITQHGWIRLFALQAWNEFNYNGDPAASEVSYKDFLNSFTMCSAFIDNNNGVITTMSNASTFLKNTYSNVNDLMTADVTGVNLATQAFGQDLINTGKVIDLTQIDKFGLPSILLKTINKYSGFTPSLAYALLSAGLSSSDVSSILSGNLIPSKLQEQQIYGAYSIITGKDLVDILIPLNCATPGLTSLIDLLDLQKLLPNSFQSLTVPVYNSRPGPTNAKTYYQIYINNGINSQLLNPEVIAAIGVYGLAPTSENVNIGTNYQVPAAGFGAYSRSCVPDNISIATGAFSFSMQQIPNVKNVPIEKFAQVVFNIESTLGLPLVTGTDVPTNTVLASGGINQIAFGSGPYGRFTMSDFFGSMTGLPYQFTDIKTYIQQLQTSTLSTIYTNIYNTIITAVGDVSATVQTYIDAANNEIANIQANKTNIANILNRMWNLTGTQLTTEQHARDMALIPVTVPKSVRNTTFPGVLVSFVNSVQEYASKTEPHMQTQTLEAISNTSTAGGQSLIALMRAIRNKDKLFKAGIPLADNIPAELNDLTTKILMGNGTVSIGKTDQGVPAGDATFTIPADHNVLTNVQQYGHFVNEQNAYCVPTTMYPNDVLGSIPNNASIGQDLAGPNIMQVSDVITPIAGGFTPQGVCENLNLGNPVVPGSLAGNPFQNLVQPQLSNIYTSGLLSPTTYTVPEAIDEVIRCNCDCWVN
jgi:hypothetical protein